jgi:MSHA biogenesis protein MshN
MSVINRMLLDLEQRHASATERAALPAEARALPQRARAGRWTLAGAAALAALGGLAGGWAFYQGRGSGPAAEAPGGSSASAAPVAAATRHGAPAVQPALPAASAPASPQAPAPAYSPSDAGAGPKAGEAGGAQAGAPIPVERVLETADAAPAAGTAGARQGPREAEPKLKAEGRETPAGSSSSEPQRAPRAEQVASLGTQAAPGARPGTKTRETAPEAAKKDSAIHKQVREPTVRERAEESYKRATVLLHAGRTAQAREGFEAALELDPSHHRARQALVGVLVNAGELETAASVLERGLELAPGQSGFAMTLARIQTDRGELGRAIATLERGLPHASGNADYLAFYAALLQRQGRHEEAVERFGSALRLRPEKSVWLLGLGLSLQALGRGAEALDAYRRAAASEDLAPELRAFAQQQARALQ